MAYIFALIFALNMSIAHAAQFRGDLTYAGIKKFMEENNIGSADELICSLPEELRSNFALVYESGSVHKKCASPAKPRIILFSPQDNFVMAVMGNTEKSECRSIEMIEQDSETGQIHAREIVPMSSKRDDFRVRLPLIGPLLGRKAPTQTPRFESSPKSCVHCHSENFKPSWGSYPNWPGVYGSNDDRLENEELRNFEKHKTQWRKSDIYRCLNWKTFPLVHPYNPGFAGPEVDRPNLRLTHQLADMNVLRVEKMLRSSNDFKNRKTEALLRLLGCPKEKKFNLEDFGIDSDELLLASREYEFLPESLRRQYNDGLSYAEDRLADSLLRDLGYESKDRQYGHIIARYRVAEESSKFFYPNQGGERPIKQRLDLCKKIKSRVKAIAASNVHVPCESPSESPFSEETKGIFGAIRSQLSKGNGAFGKCLACHTGESPIGPRIPYDSPRNLSPTQITETMARIKSTSPSKQMPPMLSLTLEEIDQIESYVERRN